MRLAVLKERAAAETRVAATPETLKKLAALGMTVAVAVEAGAGAASAIPDGDYQAVGAEVAPDAAAALAGVGLVLAVQTPDPEVRAHIPRGATLVSISGAHSDPALVGHLAEAGIDAVAMELLPGADPTIAPWGAKWWRLAGVYPSEASP